MNGFSILMFIFGILVFLVGFYMFNGHKLDILTWRIQFKNLSINEWKNIGKWTMITSLFIFMIAILALIFNFK